MKLRSECNRDGDVEREVEAGSANVTPTDSFKQWEQTLVRPDHQYRTELEERCKKFELEETEETQENSERSEVGVREELLFKGASKSETKKIVG